MADKSDDIFIYLEAVGAAEAKAAIESVSDSIDDLNSKRKSETSETTKSTSATNAEIHARNAETNATKAATAATNAITRARKEDRLEMENSQKASDDYAKKFLADLNKIEAQAKKYATGLSSSMKTAMKATESTAKDMDKASKQLDVLGRAMDVVGSKSIMMGRKMQSVGSAISKTAKKFQGLGVQIHAYALLIGALIATLPMIGTFFNALSAGALAAANGLIHMSGVLGAIPAGLLAAAQAIAVFKMGFTGLGKAMTDQTAFDALGPQAQNLVLSLNALKSGFQGIRQAVQENLLSGLSSEIINIANVYLPLLNKSLNDTAKNINTSMRNFTGWLQSGEGKSTMSGVMTTNSQVIGQGVNAGQTLLQTFLVVANAAGPMLREMAADIVSLSQAVNNWVYNNQKGIGAFFTNGYDSFKTALKTIGTYGQAFYNIIRLASPLTDAMSDGIQRVGREFLSWTESNGGIAKIQAYFAKMQPDLAAIMKLAGAVGTAIFNMSQSQGFQAFVNTLTTNTIPNFANALLNIANSGALTDIADALGKIFKYISEAPAWMVKLVVFGNMFLTILSFAATLVGGLGTAISGAGSLLGRLGVAGLGSSAGGAGAGAAAGEAGGIAAGGAAAGGSAAGGLAALGPMALIAGIGVATQAIGNWLFGGKSQNQTASQLAGKAASGNLNSFFTNSKGKGIVGFWDAAIGTSPGGVNSLSSALKAYQQTGSGLGGFFGKSEHSKIGTAFGQLDKSLANLGKSGPGGAAQAADDFAQIYNQAKQAGMTMRQLNQLFPQYNQFLKDQASDLTYGGTNKNGGTVDTSTTWVDSSGKIHKGFGGGGNPASTAAGGRIASSRFAGGMTFAGQNYLTGELGPELTMSRSGLLGMVGLNGMQMYSPSSDTAIIPASATSDPINGNYGNAPSWAKDALQNAAGYSAKRAPVSAGSGRSEGNVTYAPQITVSNSNASPQDIQKAVMTGIRKADRARRERK